MTQKDETPLLSFALPTYNRAKFLDYWLKSMIPLAKKYNIQFLYQIMHQMIILKK